MTVAAVARKAGPFINDKETAIVGPFPFTFKIFALTDVKVQRSKSTDLNTGSDTLTYGTDYTVTADLTAQDTNPGGSITLTGTISTATGTLLEPGYSLTILSDVPYSQLTKLTNYDRFMPNVLNDVHDRAVAEIQQLAEKLDRAVMVSTTSTMTPEELVTKLETAADTAEQVAASYAAQAQASASSASASAQKAEDAVEGLEDRESALEGKLEDFTDTQIARIEDAADMDFVLNATGCAEKQWTLTSNVSAGTAITIPSELYYLVGRHHLRVSYNGLVCYIGENFTEVGNTDTKSNQFKLTFDAKSGDELDVWIAALGKADVADAIATATAANDAVAELSQKVVYKDAESAGS